MYNVNKYNKYNIPITSISFTNLPNALSIVDFKYNLLLSFDNRNLVLDDIGELFVTFFYSPDISNNYRIKKIKKKKR